MATDDCAADAMIVFDGSGSMAEMGFNDIDEPRIFEARRAMADARECPIFCVTAIWSMLPERSKDDDHIQGTAGRTTEGLRAA